MYYGKCLAAMSKGLAVAAVAMGLAAGSLCAGQEKVLHTFVNKSDGNSPGGGLTFDANGDLFGTTSAGGTGEFADGTVFELKPKAGGGVTFQTIHQFSQARGDGANPGPAFILDAEGNLYGVTPNGGAGCGIVYELSAAPGGEWTETILHKFDSNGDDGCNPSGRLIFDQAGDLFGGTYNGGGGLNNLFCANGCGTTYKLHPANGKWTETVLHRFTGKGADGWNPSGGLAFDKTGNLWGTTAFGGAGNSSTCGDPNGGVGFCGTVFELTPNANGTWTESTLYSFVDASTGWNPFSGVILDKVGNLVGTTENGGSALQGTVFEITPLGGGKVTESLIHEFAGEADGAFPNSGLTPDATGALYGVVSNGGGTAFTCTENSGGGCGIVYKLTPNSDGTWTETILYTFLGGADGAEPGDDRLALSPNGDVFGSAGSGGDFNAGCPGNLPGGCGVVFGMKP
jgi:uncharacterized repeat protein (TIGR03803 family)